MDNETAKVLIEAWEELLQDIPTGGTTESLTEEEYEDDFLGYGLCSYN